MPLEQQYRHHDQRQQQQCFDKVRCFGGAQGASLKVAESWRINITTGPKVVRQSIKSTTRRTENRVV